MTPRWIRRQVEEARAERERFLEEQRRSATQSDSSLKELIHDVADVVIALRVATEDLEKALRDLARREEDRDDDNPTVGVDG